MAKDRAAVRAARASRTGAAKDDAPRRPDPLERVHTWPHFLIIEFIALFVFILLLIALSVLIKAPLSELARPEYTPNPAKAPWYFLNLQELLLHMHPSLAGVIVPTIVLVLIGAIPYIDRDEGGTAIWFTSRDGIAISKFSFVYTSIWTIGLILFDEFLADTIGPKVLLEGMGVSADLAEIVAGTVVPVILMILIPAWLVVLVRRRWNTDMRHTIIALFTAFVAAYVVLTIVGTGFRGESMRLMWPWQLEPPK